MLYWQVKCIETNEECLIWTEGDTNEDMGFIRDCAVLWFGSPKILICGQVDHTNPMYSGLPII